MNLRASFLGVLVILSQVGIARADIEGAAVFNTRWVASGSDNGDGSIPHTGLGPLFNAPSCATCHPGGARGSGPAGSGPAPASLEIMLETSGDSGAGDPVYGHVLNTNAVDGVAPEGAVSIRYVETYGYYYPDGSRWRLRTPHYNFSQLSHGPLASDTIVEPRLAPALFGVDLLEAVSGGAPEGRFGWQGASVSIRDQTTRAFSREMGVTSPDRPKDDCTPAEKDCVRSAQGRPEVSDELLTALLTFEHSLAVPESSAKPKNARLGSELFKLIGCSNCHEPRLPAQSGFIAAYTDLQLHDLGMEMADKTVSGVSVVSKWRTAPLWGFGYRLQTESQPTFLHDGRARSAEEAILWHSGEAARARRKFTELGPRSRAALLSFLETL